LNVVSFDLVRDAFTITGLEGEGIVEQIDGVIEIDSNMYLVEMKWWDKPLGTAEVSQHVMRVFTRNYARAIFISNSDFTPAAINTCREALHHKVVVLCKLQEIVMLLEQEKDLRNFFKSKVEAAIVHKNPLHEPLNNHIL
ncbi:MAG: restriction endonuclease, partial [Pyrinomonadaceae bacterium]|nr:restriction endonuclease [Pyrinomonadaceae bacterium]